MLYRKRFGQHFLKDKTTIHRIISALDIQPDDHVVEIGPGQGALTTALLQCTKQLDVIEIDRDLVQWLQENYVNCTQLHIHQADALRFDFASLAIANQPLRIVGNLPYNISTPLLFHLLKYIPTVHDITVMLQKEVVDRLVALPDTADYGRLSVMLQYACRIERLFNVSSEAFFPPPKVASSVVQLMPYATPLIPATDSAYFSQLVTRAFSQRRKTLRNALKNWLETDVITAIGINPLVRAETLTVADFVKLSNAGCATHPSP
jgi:16S rRNA (adenine1518-N6/adenine1519-N6)-dimethyltransferase